VSVKGIKQPLHWKTSSSRSQDTLYLNVFSVVIEWRGFGLVILVSIMLDSEDAAAGGGADMMTKGRLVFTCQTLKEKMGEE